jgi:hypothetical protein
MTVKIKDYSFELRSRGKRKYVQVLVRGSGGLWRIVPTRFTDEAEVMIPEVLLRCASEARAWAVLPTPAESPVLGAPGPLAPEGSFIAGVVITCSQFEEGLGMSTKDQFRRVGRYLLTHLGEKCLLPDRQVRLEHMLRVREALEADTRIVKSTYHTRYLILGLLDAMERRGHATKECLLAFEGMNLTSSPHFKCSVPYTDDDIRKFLDKVPSAPSAIRKAFFNALSGGPHAYDAITLQRDEFDSKAGRVMFARQKTGNRAVYYIIAAGLDSLASEPCLENQPFVIPEAVVQSDGSVPDLSDDKKRKWIRNRFNLMWRKFVVAAGVDPEGKSFKSIRQHLTCLLISEVVPIEVIARVLGNKVTAVLNYDFALNDELQAHRDIRERHIQAIHSGGTVDYVLTDKQLLENLESFQRESFQNFAGELEGMHSEILSDLSRALSGVEGAENSDEHQEQGILFAEFEAILQKVEHMLTVVKKGTL